MFSAFSSGTSVRDSLPQNRSAQERPQCAVTTQVHATGPHAQWTYKTKGQTYCFPRSSPYDDAIFDRDPLLVYDGDNASAALTHPSSGASIRTFASLSGAPVDLDWAVVGISRGTIDPSDGTKKNEDALAAMQVDGEVYIEHNGNKPILPMDFVELVIPPAHPGGFQPTDKSSRTRTRPMTNPTNLKSADFLNPIRQAKQAYDTAVKNVDDPRQIFENHPYKDYVQYREFKHGENDAAAFETQLKKDASLARTLIESGSLPSDTQIQASDVVMDAWVAYQVIFLLRSNELVNSGLPNGERNKRQYLLFHYQSEAATVLANLATNRARKRIVGQSLNYVNIGGTINLLVNRTP